MINSDQRIFPLFSHMANIPFNTFDIEKPLCLAGGSLSQVFDVLTKLCIFDIMNNLVSFFKYKAMLFIPVWEVTDLCRFQFGILQEQTRIINSSLGM